jgi:PAS domain S-box-containing protein
VPSALLVLDRRLNIVSANRAFYEAFRTSPPETEGRHIYALGNGQWDIPALHTLLDSVIPTRDQVDRFEVDHDFPAIGRRTFLVNARKILGPEESDGSILLAIEDVSEERAARAEARRTWLLTQSIVDTIRDPLVVLEHDMTVVTASQAFLTLFGITEAEIQGRRMADLGQHQMDVPALRYLMEKVLPDDKPIENFEIEDEFPGLGRRVYALNARKVTQAGNHSHRMLLVFNDITERKQRDRDAEVLTNEISHRIKNNLQLVVGLIGFEAKRAAPACTLGYMAMQARIGAIAQLYDLISRSASGHAIAVEGYLREIARTVSESLLGPETGITIVVEAEPLVIDADRAVPLGLLINELATNAIKHAFPSGAGQVTLRARRDGDAMELTVADDGVGLQSAEAPSQSRARGSNYVGIFVRQLGGELTTETADGAGTTLVIRLPIEAD